MCDARGPIRRTMQRLINQGRRWPRMANPTERPRQKTHTTTPNLDVGTTSQKLGRGSSRCIPTRGTKEPPRAQRRRAHSLSSCILQSCLSIFSGRASDITYDNCITTEMTAVLPHAVPQTTMPATIEEAHAEIRQLRLQLEHGVVRNIQGAWELVRILER
jgi:hypothetical protein